MASEDPASLAALPSPLHITLLLKSARHTVLLSVLPSTPFTEVAALLLLALKSRNISSIAGSPVPSPDQREVVEFGIPKDKNDLKKGFIPLSMAEQVLSDSKAGKKKVNGIKSSPSENPMGVGLDDGSTLAFRFKSSEEMQEVESDSDEARRHPQPRWNVELPQYEDENE